MAHGPRTAAAYVCVLAACLLTACANPQDEVRHESFTDPSGRACTYLLVVDRDQDDDESGPPDLDARTLDCDPPPPTEGPPP